MLCESWCLCGFSEVNNLIRKELQDVNHSPGAAEKTSAQWFSSCSPWEGVVRHTSAFRFPAAKTLKVEKGISARDCRQIRRQHRRLCFTLVPAFLFFRPGSVMQIWSRPFRQVPCGMQHISGWSSKLDDCHTPACTQTHRYTHMYLWNV